MNLRTSWDAAGALGLLGNLEEALAQPAGILRRWSRYLQQKTKDRFAAGGPGWAPLAESTEQDRQHRYTGRITMGGEVRASYAKRRQSAVKGQILQALRRGEGGARKGKSLSAVLGRYHEGTAKLQQAAARQKQRIRDTRQLAHVVVALVAEGLGDLLATAAAAQRKLHKGQTLTGQESRAIEYKKLAGKKGPSSGKTVAEKQAGRPLLGRIAAMIHAKLFARGVEVGLVNDEAARRFSIHDQGGVAGHGAQIPQRAFAYLDAEDPEALAQIAEDTVQERLRKA